MYPVKQTTLLVNYRRHICFVVAVVLRTNREDIRIVSFSQCLNLLPWNDVTTSQVGNTIGAKVAVGVV